MSSKNGCIELSVLRTTWIAVVVLFALSACKDKFVRNKEARENQEVMQNAIAANEGIKFEVFANGETDPVHVKSVMDDAADDPAIWYHKKEPSRSVIFGANKLRGINSYNLQGKEIQNIDFGKINNIDIRQGVYLGNKKLDILGASNRTDNSVDLFIIDSTGMISDTADYKIPLGKFAPYGFCLYQSSPKDLYAFVNKKSGTIRQIKIALNTKNSLQFKTVRNLELETQVEGMVCDDKHHLLYVGEEQTGIHVFNAKENGAVDGSLWRSSTQTQNKYIAYDIEGLALMEPHYLLASSQGNFSYAIFDRRSSEYLFSFKISEAKFDGVMETDGIELIDLALDSTYSAGMLVVQDGYNYNEGKQVAQNFKMVDLSQIKKLLNNRVNEEHGN